MFSSKKVIEVGNLYKTLSKEAISKRLGIDIESVSRYIRAFKKGLPPEPIKKKSIKANVLLFDIETLFGVGRFWRVWKENIAQWQIIKPVCMLSWSAKWLFEPEVFGDIMTKKETIERNDKRITQNLWHYMEKANVVIAHNGKAFDIQKINTEFLLHGLGQPAPYKVIDTCLVARKYFSFEHNTLDALAERLGVARKIKTDNSLWVQCDSGDESALAEMLTYNKQDVNVLEEVYVKLRPWIKDHPNLALFHDVTENEGKPICRTCVSPNLTEIGEYMTSVNTYDSYRCNDCGAIHRARRANTSLKKDTHILQGIS
ncbi:MAG: ribonuclease H-like domain-containing protein [Candidatus Omnitrophica bacterium]|nr:ribonuclease H-like domain-containing protein [Candidatus Omnitrophota bacterium]